ncbi:hypothetical protein JRO89_XS05G0213400 [Xanthoceras sorbifolium]|uniref:EF-hand domain-containing protein n=1 Tax=Xanthoceras sorbifolium TaxID=99658 RepID=A0ABQ8I2N5_9ROSI|nr:hypothetical protein JRO89_XS05G0213400 [Xanthoceras sorbifolium]
MGFGSIFHRKKKQNSSSSSRGSPTTESLPRNNNTTTATTATAIPQIHELEQVFKRFDANGDGKISVAELGAIMSSLGYNATEEELQKMMREIDSDGDGFIDLDEFIELNTKGVDSKEVLENLKDAFSVYDIDGNGSITAEELFKVLKSLGDECTMAECRKMISGVDSDGDGMINFEEFKVMMMMGARYDSMSTEVVN